MKGAETRLVNFGGQKGVLYAFFSLLLLVCGLTPESAHAQTTTTYSNTTTGTVNSGVTGGQQCISRTFAVATNIIVGDIDIGLLASTTNRSTVTATLTSAAGTTVTLFDRDGTANAGINARFDDAAATAYTASNVTHNTATAPYQFTLRPTGTLSSFNGENANGTWTLQVCNTGLLAPTVTFTRADLYVTSIAQAVSDLSLTKTVANATPANGAATSYTLTLTSAAGWANAANVTVRDLLPAGTTFVSATASGGGTYNSGTGIWTVPTINTGTSQTLTINFTVSATAGATVTNTAEVASSPNFDFDSTPNNGVTTEDDYATRSFTVSGTRVAGTPPTLTCPIGTTLFDWDTVAWASGSTSNSYTVTGFGSVGFSTTISGGTFLNNATYGGQSPARQNVMTGGFTPAQYSIIWITDFTSQSGSATTTVTLPVVVNGAQFRLFDIDANAGQYADRATITGSLNGVGVTPTLTNGVANYVIGNSAYGDAVSADTSANGNIVVTFSSPIDTIVINYGNHSAAPADPGQQAITMHDFTFCNPQANLSVTKVSSVISDPISASNPKAVPGAVIQYCILTSNAGTATATAVTATDTIPTNLTYVAGSMFSGTSCAGATTAEDDNNTGADESDPYGASITGTTITGVAPSLASSVSFALVFRATVN